MNTQTTNLQTIQIIELGSAAELTLGYLGNLSENCRPNQHTSGGVVVSGDRGR